MRIQWALSTVLVIGCVAVQACKQRQAGSQLLDQTGDHGPKRHFDLNAPDNTAELQEYLAQIADDPAGKQLYQINNEAFKNKVGGFKDDMNDTDPYATFKVPFKEFVPFCPPDRVNNSHCIVADNMFSYRYGKSDEPGRYSKPYIHLIPMREGETQDAINHWLRPGDVIVYTHLERRPGEFAATSAGEQWRTTHAATIVPKRLADGNYALATADTPAGYAQPFTGVDDTPFHVFRFMPKDDQFNDLPLDQAQVYRESIAKWATLGFNQFQFSGDYNAANGTMVSEFTELQDEFTNQRELDQLRTAGKCAINDFARKYAIAAYEGMNSCGWGQVSPDCFPGMYCAWFVYNNVALAWTSPMTSRGSAQALLTRPGTAEFQNIDDHFAWRGSKVRDGNYLIDADVSDHKSAPFPRFVAGTLMAGVMRMIGDEDPARLCITLGFDPAKCSIDPATMDPQTMAQVAVQWAKNAKGKADLLPKLFSQNSRTFFGDDSRVPLSDGAQGAANTAVAEADEQIKRQVEAFSQMYNASADRILGLLQASGGQPSPQQVGEAIGVMSQSHAKIRDDFKNAVREKDGTALRGGVKRWIPPYIFMYIAENYNYLRGGDDSDAIFPKSKPFLMYVGTVVHEKYVQPFGAGATAPEVKAFAQKDETPDDLELDKEMYEAMDFPGQQLDMPAGKGYQFFFQCLYGTAAYCKGKFDPAPQQRFNEFEKRALMAAMNDYVTSTDPNGNAPENIVLKNTYGLDPTTFRRLLASYWNDPAAAFRPNFLQTAQGPRQLVDNVKNFRILFGSPTPRGRNGKFLADQQAVDADPSAIPNTNMFCKAPQSVPANGDLTCRAALGPVNPQCAQGAVSNCANYVSFAGPDPDYGAWPNDPIRATGGPQPPPPTPPGPPPQVQGTCEKICWDRKRRDVVDSVNVRDQNECRPAAFQNNTQQCRTGFQYKFKT